MTSSTPIRDPRPTSESTDMLELATADETAKEAVVLRTGASTASSEFARLKPNPLSLMGRSRIRRYSPRKCSRSLGKPATFGCCIYV